MKRIAQLLRRPQRPTRVGEGCEVARQARFFHAARIRLGRHVYIGPRCHLNGEGGIEVGDGAILGPQVTVLSANHDYRHGEALPYSGPNRHQPVRIGRGVWIGFGAMLAPGSEVGDGAVVAMGAVVSGAVPPGAVVAGNPARQVAERDPQALQALLDKQAWWLVRRGPRHQAD